MFSPESEDKSKKKFKYTDDQKIELYNWLGHIIDKCIEVHHGHYFQKSEKILLDIVNRTTHEIERLLDGQESGQLHPAKYISYFSFWIRKLKPISMCYPKDGVTADSIIITSKEITDINELIALSLITRTIFSSGKNNSIPEFTIFSDNEAELKKLFETNPEKYGVKVAKALKLAFFEYFNLSSDVGNQTGNERKSLVYDMRYRSFGAHHLTHLCFHVISLAKKDLSAA